MAGYITRGKDGIGEGGRKGVVESDVTELIVY